jgi:hypothetical protein
MDATTIVLLTVFAIIVVLGLAAVGVHALLAQARAPRAAGRERDLRAEPIVLRFDDIRDGGTAQARFRARSLTCVPGVSSGHLQHLQHLTTAHSGEHLLVEVTVGTRILWSWITIRQLHERLRNAPVTLVPGVEMRIDMQYAFPTGAPISALLPLDAWVADAPKPSEHQSERDAKVLKRLAAGLSALWLNGTPGRPPHWSVCVDGLGVEGLSDPLLFDPFLEVLYKNGDCLRVTCNPPGQGREQFCVERTEERGTMENPDERSELLYQGNERDVLEWLSNYGRTGGGK